MFVDDGQNSCLFTDRSGLAEPEKVEELQEPILEALKHYVRRRRTGNPHTFAKMLLKLTDLRSISVKGSDNPIFLEANRREWSALSMKLVLFLDPSVTQQNSRCS